MASHINRGETLLIPFENGQSIYDSQLRPRMYKSMQALKKALPKHFRDTYKVEVVEYAEVKHGEWMKEGCCFYCSECKKTYGFGSTQTIYDVKRHWLHCPKCGAKMDGKE